MPNTPSQPNSSQDAVDPRQRPLFDSQSPAKSEPSRSPPNSPYSDFVVYVDESGDHSLESIDPQYPVFVLAFCVFYKRHYAHTVVPSVETLKFKHFGHDLIVLHETDIRKEKGPFRFTNRAHKHAFMDELHGLIETDNFILISSTIDKFRLRERNQNPYHVALGFCLETLQELMREKHQDAQTTHVVVECRGKKEDGELELEFRRICGGANKFGKPLSFKIIFADKKTNSIGLQLADLVARPIGLSVIKPEQPNRAFDVLKRKFFCSGGRRKVGDGYEGWGHKIYPAPESERPR